jgi:arsenate reductase
MPLDPVPAFAALAHPQRLAVLQLLIRHHPVPVPAGTIAERLDLRASTLSGYLAQMMEAGLIRQTRHGTSLHYGAALDGIAALNAAWIGGICGGHGWPEPRGDGQRIRNLLILGRGNAGPTLAAEAIFRREAGASWEVFSGGVAYDDASHGAPDPKVIQALTEAGYDTEPLFAKPLALVTGPDAPQPDAVVILGETALGTEPNWPGQPIRARWVMPAAMRPAALIPHLEARVAAFAALDPALEPSSRLLAALENDALV